VIPMPPPTTYKADFRSICRHRWIAGGGTCGFLAVKGTDRCSAHTASPRPSACACDSMGTCLAHELSPNRCNCNIAWASPTPRPVCPDHGHHRDVELLTLRFLPSEVM